MLTLLGRDQTVARLARLIDFLTAHPSQIS
jgi:hypothetical protein